MNGIKYLSPEEGWRSVLRVSLGLFLLAPFLIWLLQVSAWTLPETHEWAPALRISLVQALLSAVFSCAFGFVLFGAFQAWGSSRARHWIELSLLFPNMIPPIFLCMSLLSLFLPLGGLPYGIGSVVFAHVLLNAGLVTVALDRLVHHKMGGLVESAWVLGASRVQFWREVAWPYLRADFACIFLFVFSLCFTSFSIPLLLSGERAVTLEVAIYDTIRTEGAWDKAVLLAAMQSIMLFLFAWALPQPFWPSKPARQALGYLAWRRAKWLALLPLVLIVGGWVQGWIMSWSVHIEPEIWHDIAEGMITTAIIGVSVGLLHLLLFLVVAFVLPHRRLDRFLNGYLAPSPAITGFGLLLVPLDGELINLCKLAVALTLISFPLLYRWIVHSALSSVRNQVLVARSLGASWREILFEIVWPQAAPQILRACGVAAIWGCGDFALSGIVLGETFTLPLIIEGLLNSYRIEAAQLLLFPLVLVGLFSYSLFVGAARYVSR